MTTDLLRPGDVAPDFALATDAGTVFRLSEQRGHPVVLFFYPDDDTPLCTTEAQTFSGLAYQFAAHGVVVAGVSPNSVASHCSFRDKYRLTVPLIADPEHEAIDRFGVWQLKNRYGRQFMGLVRTTVMIDGDGSIAAVWPNIRVKGHADRVLAAARDLVATKSATTDI